jgi:AcrR family transcriptional regulator
MSNMFTVNNLKVPPGFPDGTKGEILKVGLLLFIEMGYGGVTMAAIAKKSKMSKPNVAYHYKDPSEILFELMRYWAASGQSVAANHLLGKVGEDIASLIVANGEATFIWAQEYPELGALTPVLIQAARTNNKIADFQKQVLTVGLSRIKSLLEQFYKSSKVKDKRITEVSTALHCIVVGSFLYALAQESDLETAKKSVRNTILSILK